MKLQLVILTGAIVLTITQSFMYPSVPMEDNSEMLPELSGYHIFRGNQPDLIPANEFKSYELASGLFSDYAEKQRLIKIPAGAVMKAVDDGLPVFPDGTILVKTFYYFNDKGNPSKGKRIIETRLLIKTNAQWRAGTYRWNEAQTDATLITAGATIPVEWIDETGKTNTISYHVPANKECASCHNSNKSIIPIGPKIRNLNRDVIRNDTTINQLTYLQAAGMLEPMKPSSFTALPNWQSNNWSLEQRARAYLDINCAHCHNQNGYCAAANFHPAYEISFTGTNIKAKQNRIVRLMKRKQMPRLGTTVIHEEGITLIENYIKSLQ